MDTSKSYTNIKFPKANTNIKNYKWLLGITQTRIYSCICPECNKDYFDYIYGDMDRYMFEDNLPQYCPNCGKSMIEVNEND